MPAGPASERMHAGRLPLSHTQMRTERWGGVLATPSFSAAEDLRGTVSCPYSDLSRGCCPLLLWQLNQ